MLKLWNKKTSNLKHIKANCSKMNWHSKHRGKKYTIQYIFCFKKISKKFYKNISFGNIFFLRMMKISTAVFCTFLHHLEDECSCLYLTLENSCPIEIPLTSETWPSHSPQELLIVAEVLFLSTFHTAIIKTNEKYKWNVIWTVTCFTRS